jgi:hypothetical protein
VKRVIRKSRVNRMGERKSFPQTRTKLLRGRKRRHAEK